MLWLWEIMVEKKDSLAVPASAAEQRKHIRFVSSKNILSGLPKALIAPHILAILGVKGVDWARIISRRLAFRRVSYSIFPTAEM